MFEYTPYTSAELTSGNTVLEDLSSFTGIGELPSFPSGRQVIFFTIGIICIVTAIAMMSKTLIAENLPEITKAAKSVII